jgi:hypothetical protein
LASWALSPFACAMAIQVGWWSKGQMQNILFLFKRVHLWFQEFIGFITRHHKTSLI